MLPQKHRFTSKNFEFLRRKMKSFRSKNFLFLYGPDRKKSHFAAVVSKKTDKRAVQRNRLRRQLYEQFRINLLPTVTNLNLICLYKGDQIPENPAEIQNAVEEFKQFYVRKVKKS